ncbi:pilin [Cupriavidus taiwanensis]|uniref:pilin n=1 Tax=Cupriavidus taiwanensis TaxID=164546 RepID=UPI000E167409|nr:prepilin-type N-terminal cleavage/methylation domain-containing protein [Cupriavidus taiwanensis]SPC07088.1 General secretion pathway protein H [Cupriavidus taiwanensis]
MQRVQQLKKLGRRVQKGFTLIELMIVVAIIGILAAIAIPQYQDYVTRSRWTENTTSIAGLKQAIAECVQQNAMPAGAVGAPCDTAAALNAANTGVGFTAMPVPRFAVNPNGVTYAGGVITITGTAQVGSCVVTFTPTITAAAVTWVGATAAAPAGCGRAQTGI